MFVSLNIDILRQYLPSAGGAVPHWVYNNNSMGATLLSGATPETLQRVRRGCEDPPTRKMKAVKRGEINRRLECPAGKKKDPKTQFAKVDLIAARRQFFDARYVFFLSHVCTYMTPF